MLQLVQLIPSCRNSRLIFSGHVRKGMLIPERLICILWGCHFYLANPTYRSDSVCHPERSEGSPNQQQLFIRRSFASLRMTNRVRMTITTPQYPESPAKQ